MTCTTILVPEKLFSFHQRNHQLLLENAKKLTKQMYQCQHVEHYYEALGLFSMLCEVVRVLYPALLSEEDVVWFWYTMSVLDSIVGIINQSEDVIVPAIPIKMVGKFTTQRKSP